MKANHTAKPRRQLAARVLEAPIEPQTSSQLPLPAQHDPGSEVSSARTAERTRRLMSHGRAAATLAMFSKRARLDVGELCKLMQERVAQIASGDMSPAESMLLMQAMSLEAIYHDLAVRAAECSEVQRMDFLLRLGLKAQTQSRAALQTLSEMRNPRQVAFVKQANIANGHQQVNNGSDRSGAARARGEFGRNQNELLGDHGALDA